MTDIKKILHKTVSMEEKTKQSSKASKMKVADNKKLPTIRIRPFSL